MSKRTDITEHKFKEPWPDDKVREAAALYVSSGNLVKLSKTTGIPHSTLRSLRDNSEVWHSTVAMLREEKVAETVAQYDAIIEAATAQTLAKLPEADARSSMTIAAIAQDKQRTLLGLASRITDGGADSIAKLNAQFQQLARESRRYREIDASVVPDDVSD